MNELFKTILKLLSIIFIGMVAITLIFILIVGIFVFVSYLKDQEYEKYKDHGFDYMNGYSSTNFTGYHVYDGDKLISLDHPSEFIIEDIEDMPILDGAEACYPVYSAIAKAVYKDIDEIELDAYNRGNKNYQERSEEESKYYFCNGRIVTFTNSKDGYNRLIEGDADLFFGARPSSDQKEYAKSINKIIISIPIGKEAFIFFVEEDNPIDNLSSDDVRKIFSGEITNWKELGGKNQKIIAFQRPEDSGSQVMMKYFMGVVSLKEAETIERVDAMGGAITAVKQYHNEKGAIGYTFNYFLTGLNQETGVKILSIDGVYPNIETISNDTYPIIVDLVCAKLQDNEKENVDKLIDFLLSKDGQYIIEKTGYGGLKDTTRKEIIEN